MDNRTENPVYNPEGYLDTTAYLAIYKRRNKMVNCKDGDILKFNLGGKYKYRLVLKTHTNFATTIFLFEDESRENEFAVNAGSIMHVDLGKLGYTTGNDLDSGELVRRLNDKELEDIRNQVAECMGVSLNPISFSDNTEEKNNKELMEMVDELLNKNVEYKEQLVQIKRNYESAKSELEQYQFDKKTKENAVDTKLKEAYLKTAAERNIYEKLYYELLNRMNPSFKDLTAE